MTAMDMTALSDFEQHVLMLDVLSGFRGLNDIAREELCAMNIDLEKLTTYQLGMEKGARDRNVAIAKALLGEGMDIARIAAITGLPLENVEALSQENPPWKG